MIVGNIAMISEGRPLADNRFRLCEGILQLELDKPTYERCGLVGKPMASEGRKHIKQRYRKLDSRFFIQQSRLTLL
jgi:ribonuclease P/MRP protein subunit RPP40